jgi:hypothetical protein
VELIVGLEGVRTTAVFLHRHCRARVAQVAPPAHEAQLAAYPEFVRELERYHDSHRLCDVRGTREDPLTGGPKPTVMGPLVSARKVRDEAPFGRSALVLAFCRLAVGLRAIPSRREWVTGAALTSTAPVNSP